MNATAVLTDYATQRPDGRPSRIVAAALEVFSEFSFRDATTAEIAKRARVSKREIYASFPHKHALLAAVVEMILKAGDESITSIVSLSRTSMSLQEQLEVIGLALINEILSPGTEFLSRLIPGESITHPPLGTTYFGLGYRRRVKLISEVLSPHAGTVDPESAAGSYLALVTHLPMLTAMIGMGDRWNSKSVQSHVEESVLCFLNAYPGIFTGS
jgi:AcrR family transcriptional regulator